MEKRRIICKVTIDVILFCCVGIPVILYFYLGSPYKRGFFCDDESLSYPYKDSTVSTAVLYVYGALVPAFFMVVCEFVRLKTKKKGGSQNLRFGSFGIFELFIAFYGAYGIFAFGAACSQLATDIAKYSIGRLRPHFFAVCVPDMSACKAGEYMEQITCTNQATSWREKDARLSFPSGHASFSFYTMVYLAFYLQSRMIWRGSGLARPFIQFLCLMSCWYISLSRVSDYKHHWSDVLAGSLLGTVVAIAVFQSHLQRDRLSAFKAEVKSSDDIGFRVHQV